MSKLKSRKYPQSTGQILWFLLCVGFSQGSWVCPWFCLKKLKSINSYIFVVLLLVWFIVAVLTWCKLILCDRMWKCQLT